MSSSKVVAVKPDLPYHELVKLLMRKAPVILIKKKV